MSTGHISRRSFMGGAAAFGAAAILARDGVAALAPSERLNIAGIGTGGQGKNDIMRMRELGHNVVALCDVDWKNSGKFFEAFPDAKLYKDYRVMFDTHQDFDAVVIATPDHHHAPASMAALQLGKHVYCEKPLTHSVHEARELARAARSAGVATQMGNTGQASDGARTLAEMIASGVVGPVREVHVWTNRPIWPQGIARPEATHRVPEDLDWDLWLGPAPARPYNRIYHPFRWRGWWDFGTGALGDIGCHSFHPLFKALNLLHPTSVEANTTKQFPDSFPLASIIYYQFPARGTMPPLKLTWYDGGMKPARPKELDEGVDLPEGGNLIIGDTGTLFNGRLIPEARMQEYELPPETLPRSIGHWEEWIAACKGGEAAGASFDFAGPLTETVLLGNIAIRTGKKLHWDPEAMKITNVPEANQFLRREYREGWSL